MTSRIQEMWDDFSIENAVLSPLSLLYAIGWTAYWSAYEWGLKKPSRPHRPVVCVGNLLAGGSGKTPLTLHVAEVLASLGKQVVVGVSGYGSPASRAATLAPSGPLRAAEWGDEAAMVRWLRPELPLVVGRDRVKAAEVVNQAFPHAVLLMDDGYQHLRLQTDIRIVIDPPGRNRLCLPAGPYRETRKFGLRRASLLVPGQFDLQPTFAFLDPASRPIQPPEPQPVNLVCAIARPHRVVATLEYLGYLVNRANMLSDHDPLTSPKLWDMLDQDLLTVVTSKDWVKLRERPDLEGRRLWIAHYWSMIKPEAEFSSWLSERLQHVQT